MKKRIQDYIIVVKPNRRATNKLTDIALVTDNMDINIDITSNMKKADWFDIPGKHGNKVWKKRNYALSPFRITTCTELKRKGISTSLGRNLNTSTQSGWGEVDDLIHNTHRVIYCYEENILKILEYGFFDKTASMFKKADKLSLVA